jgi:hypothetical protein
MGRIGSPMQLGQIIAADPTSRRWIRLACRLSFIAEAFTLALMARLSPTISVAQDLPIVIANSRSPRSLISICSCRACPTDAISKTTKTLTYWPGLTIAERRVKTSWRTIVVALETEVGSLGFKTPDAFASFGFLKPYEDALDGSWVGACFLRKG